MIVEEEKVEIIEEEKINNQPENVLYEAPKSLKHILILFLIFFDISHKKILLFRSILNFYINLLN